MIKNCKAETLLQAGGGEPPHGSLGSAINESFSSFEKLIAKMNAEGAAVQGSGWVVCLPAILLAYSLLVLYIIRSIGYVWQTS